MCRTLHYWESLIGGGGCLEGNPTLTAKCHQCFVIVSQLVSQLVSHEPHNAWVYT